MIPRAASVPGPAERGEVTKPYGRALPMDLIARSRCSSDPAAGPGACRRDFPLRECRRTTGCRRRSSGLFTVSRRRADRGRFRAPTLRNIAATGPYMHDGRFATLEAVIDHYARGGTPARNRSRLVTGFAITAEEKCDLIAFLESLTDEAFLRDPRLSNPWPRDNRP